MSILRDCVLHGQTWGFTEKEYNAFVELASETVTSYLEYYDQVLTNQQNKLTPGAPTSQDNHRTNIHNYWQEFRLQSIVAYDDYRLLVQHLDPFTHPGPTREFPFKDAHSRAYGTADNWDTMASNMSIDGGVGAPYSLPLRGFNQIYMEFFNYGPRKVDVSYTTGNGPLVRGLNRVNQYGVIAQSMNGVQTSTVTFPDPGPNKRFNVKSARVRSGSTPIALSLFMDDGSEKWLWDKHVVTGGQVIMVEVPGRNLTTLNMWTLSNFYDYNMACIVFGFSRDPVAIPPTVLRAMYVSELGGLPAELEKMITVDSKLKEERAAYWRHIRAMEPSK
ncbi:hypothetical protein C8J56DRAFT_533651 [Mycena floridula]|nr:hypothetical protein C8J56DRAFT_533651 [Mycena floridula]